MTVNITEKSEKLKRNQFQSSLFYALENYGSVNKNILLTFIIIIKFIYRLANHILLVDIKEVKDMEYALMFIVGICATTLGTLAGGGGLISLPMMLMMGMPVHSAIGANKVSNTVSSFSSFYILYKRKEISLKESFWIVPVSVGGGISGGFIASGISGDNMYMIAIVLLMFAFLTSFVGKGNFTGEQPLKMNKVSVPGLYGIGIYDGLFGPGQGTLMLYLFGYLNIAYIRAVGLVRLATFSSCFGAAITYIATGKIIWPLTIALLLGSTTGAQIGVRIAQRLKPQYIKPILRIVTAALIVQIFVENIF